jgi:DNA-directed RNA polymerase subunit beta
MPITIKVLKNNTFLLPRDVLAATDHLNGMKFGTGILDDDDIYSYLK